MIKPTSNIFDPPVLLELLPKLAPEYVEVKVFDLVSIRTTSLSVAALIVVVVEPLILIAAEVEIISEEDLMSNLVILAG